ASCMRVHVRRVMGGGGVVPTASEVVEAVGGTVSLALQVLAEFPDYLIVHGQRRSPSLRGMPPVGARRTPGADVPVTRLGLSRRDVPPEPPVAR
ncbi:MAG: hypothetical protein ABGY41_07125, partial [Candidatus Poribacteria bacterium]